MRAAITKSELPQRLFIPTLQLPQGHIDFQLSDHDGNIVLLAWATGAGATSWLQDGGLDLCKSNEPSISHNLALGRSQAVIRIEARDRLFELNEALSVGLGARRRLLHFEPDHGALFAPPERRVSFVA
jgi:hypothetical protein